MRPAKLFTILKKAMEDSLGTAPRPEHDIDQEGARKIVSQKLFYATASTVYAESTILSPDSDKVIFW